MNRDQMIEGFRQQESKRGPLDRLSIVFVEVGEEKEQERRAYTDSGDLGKPFLTACEGRVRANAAFKRWKPKSTFKFPECSDFAALQKVLSVAHVQWNTQSKWWNCNHSIMQQLARTLGCHQALLNAFPSPDAYVEVFCRAIGVIVKGSLWAFPVLKIENICMNMIKLNDCVQVVLERITIFSTDEIRNGFASLYSRIFRYLAQEIEHFPSSPTIGLANIFAKADHEDPFARQDDKIESFSQGIAPIGLQESNRTPRDAADGDTKYDPMVDAVGQARIDAEQEAIDREHEQRDFAIEKQKKRLSSKNQREKVNDKLTNLLVASLAANEGRHQCRIETVVKIDISETETKYSKAPPSPAYGSRDTVKKTIYKHEELLDHSQCLEMCIVGEDMTASLLDKPPALAISTAIFSRLKSWISATQSERLWVAGPSDYRYPSKLSTMVASVVRLLSQEDPLVIFYFCELPSKEDLKQGETRETGGLLSLMYSLIRQLICKFESTIESDKDLSQNRFESLDGTMNTWSEALHLFRDLVSLSSPYIICVIDGIERLDYRDGKTGFEKLLEKMMTIMNSDEDEEEGMESRVFKLLFTTAGKSGTLLRNLPQEEMLIEDERRGSFDLGRCAPGRTALGGLVHSSE